MLTVALRRVFEPALRPGLFRLAGPDAPENVLDRKTRAADGTVPPWGPSRGCASSACCCRRIRTGWWSARSAPSSASRRRRSRKNEEVVRVRREGTFLRYSANADALRECWRSSTPSAAPEAKPFHPRVSFAKSSAHSALIESHEKRP